MLMAAVIWPATEKFNTSVRDGSLDYTLLQPANSLFLVSFSRIVVWRIWDLVLAVILIAVGVTTERRGNHYLAEPVLFPAAGGRRGRW